MIYTCIYSCKEDQVHHIEVKKYKSAPHVSPLHSERSWSFFKYESEVYDFLRNIQGCGVAGALLYFLTSIWWTGPSLQVWIHVYIILSAPDCILSANHINGMKAPPILLYFSENRKLLTQIWRNSMNSMIVKDWYEGRFCTFRLHYDVLNISCKYKYTF